MCICVTRALHVDAHIELEAPPGLVHLHRHGAGEDCAGDTSRIAPGDTTIAARGTTGSGIAAATSTALATVAVAVAVAVVVVVAVVGRIGHQGHSLLQ